MQLLKHAFVRLNRKVPFVGAAVVGSLVIASVTALAFYSATGSGTITGIAAGTTTATLSVNQNSSATYSGPSTTSLVPGGTVTIPLIITCTANPPCTWSSMSLASWSSTKPAPCDPT